MARRDFRIGASDFHGNMQNANDRVKDQLSNFMLPEGEARPEDQPYNVGECEWLVNKKTGEIFPWCEGMAGRGDIVEQYDPRKHGPLNDSGLRMDGGDAKDQIIYHLTGFHEHQLPFAKPRL